MRLALRKNAKPREITEAPTNREIRGFAVISVQTVLMPVVRASLAEVMRLAIVTVVSV